MVTEIMCQHAFDVKEVAESGDDMFSDYLDSWLSLLENVVEEPYRLSMQAATCSASLMQGILNVSKVSGLHAGAEMMQSILDGMDAIFSYEYFYRAELQTPLERQLLILNISHLLYSYCEVATDVNRTTSVVGQPSYLSAQSRLAVTAIVLPLDAVDITEVYVPYQSSYLRVPTQGIGPYCLVTYDKTAYATRVENLLMMDTFSVSPGPFLNGTENITTSWPDGHFVMDLSDINTWNVVAEFNVTCPLLSTNYSTPFFVPCLNYTHYVVQCSEDVGMWNFNCPDDMRTNMSCSRIIGNVTEDYSESCNAEFGWNNSVSCMCRKAMKVEYGDRFVAVEFGSVLFFVLMDFCETWASIKTMNTDEVRRGLRDITVIAVAISILCATVAYADHVAAKKTKDSLIGLKESQVPLKTFTQFDTEASDFMTKYCDADTIFPETCRSESFYKIFITEIKRAHRWVSLLCNHKPEYPRYMKVLFLVSVVNCMMFLNTLLFNWLRADPTRCSQFETVSECLEEPSKFAHFKSMCYWDREMEIAGGANNTLSSFCFPSTPSSEGNLVLMTTAIAGLLSIPMVLLLEFIVVHVLCRPVMNPNRVIPLSILQESDVVGVGRRSSSFVASLCGNKKKIQVDTEKRSNLASEVFLDTRQLLCDLQRYRMKLKPRDVHDFDSRWGFGGKVIEELLSELEKHHYLRSAEGNFEQIAVARDRLAAAPCCCLSTSRSLTPPIKSEVFVRLWNDILEVRLKAEEELDFMEKNLLSKDSRGNHMIMLFKRDLLQGLHSKLLSKLFISRLISHTSTQLAEVYCRYRIPISRGVQVFGYIILFVINIFFVLYMFLFSLRQSQEGCREEWLRGFMIWICLEIVLLSTFIMITSTFVPMMVAMKDLIEIGRLFKTSIVSALRRKCNATVDDDGDMRRSRCNSAGEVMRKSERSITIHPLEACEEPFDTTPYFFVSRKLAKAFPELLESRVIKQFRSVIPNRPYSHWSGPMHSDRRYLRLAACIESTTVVIVHVLLSVMSVIPALEYYVLSIMGWMLLGYLSSSSGNRVFGNLFEFNGYFLLVLVLVFYLTLFLVGRKVLNIMQREYKVGRASLLTKEDIRKRMNKAKLVTGARWNLGLRTRMNSVVPGVIEDNAAVVTSTVTEMQQGNIEEKMDECDEKLLQRTPVKSGTSTNNNQFPLLHLSSSDDDSGSADLEIGTVESCERNRMTYMSICSSDEEIGKEQAARNIEHYLHCCGREDVLSAQQYVNDMDKISRPLRVLLCDSDSDSEGDIGVGQNIDEMDIIKSAEYLISKDIYLDDGSNLSNYSIVAGAVMRMGEDIFEKSDSECDSASLDGFDDSEILKSYRYLTEIGVSLPDGADPSKYVKLARAIRMCNPKPKAKKKKEIGIVKKLTELAMESSDSEDIW